jgi:hypothetical protein
MQFFNNLLMSNNTAQKEISMKPKPASVFSIVVILVTIVACGQKTVTTPPPAAQLPVETAPQPTVQPTIQPTVEPTPTLTPVPAGPCENVFYPFIPGYQWIYKMDDGDDQTDDGTKLGLTVSSVDGSQAKVDALDLSSGVVTHTLVDCEDGAIKNYPLLTVGTLFGSMLNGQMDVSYLSGVFMPAERDLAAANWVMNWTGSSKASGTFSLTDEGETTTLTLQDSPIQLDWSLVGQEPITVEAGTYPEAYKVTRKATANVSIEVQGMSLQGVLILNTSQWYAAKVGLLKNVVDSSSLAYLGSTFPLEFKTRMELVEFRPGQ